MTELLAYIKGLQGLAGVAPKQPLSLQGGAGAAAAAAGGAPPDAPAVFEGPLVAAGVDGPADSEDEVSEEQPAAAPAKRRRRATRS